MGSASSNSKVIPASQERWEDEAIATTVHIEDTVKLKSQVEKLERLIKLKDEACKRADEKLLATECQVASLYAEVSQLQECLAVKEDPCKSCLALERLVNKQKEELSLAKDEMEKLELNYEKRLQRVRASSAKSQAESALSLFELRDENQQLAQENSRLLEHVRQSKESSTCGSCGHMELIVDLSQQLSAQEVELSKAREVLKTLEADKY